MEGLYKNLGEIFFFFFLGYVLTNIKLFSESYSKAYTDFIINVGFPGLVFYNIYNLHLSFDAAFVVFLGYVAIFLSILISIIVGRMLNLDKKSLTSFVLLSSFGNTGFLGYPFISSLYGEDALRYAVLFDQIAMFLPIYILAPIIIYYGSSEKESLNFDIKRVIFFPPFLAFVLAIFAKITTYPLSFLVDISQTLGKTVIPLIMFSIGMNIKLANFLKRIRDILSSILIKMLLTPLIILGILIFLRDDISLPLKVAVIQSAMPPMVLASIFIIDADLDKELATSVVAFGVIVSFILIPLMFYIVEFCAKL